MWHMGDGWGWWMLFGWIWMVAFWGLIFGAIVSVFRRTGPRVQESRGEPAPLQILERRYARGELDDEEFERRRARILNNRSP